MSDEYCSVCLQPDTFLKSITETDESNTSYLSKLGLVAPKQEWLDFYELCTQCVFAVNTSYSFCMLCFELEALRKEKIIKKELVIKNELNEQEDSVSDNFIESNKCSDTESEPEPIIDQHVCSICSEEFATKKALTTHKKTKHPKKKQSSPVADKFFCEFCNEKFAFMKLIKDHYFSVHSLTDKEIKPYSCNVCKSRFRSSGTYYEHIKNHGDQRTFICSTCGKSFLTKRSLRTHEVIHSDTRTFNCKECDKWFISKKNLRTHNLVVHTDSKSWKFECSICNKKFAVKTSFDQHVQRHTGEKKFMCHICPGNKSFVTNIELKKHIERHTNVKNNKCEHCEKEYRSKESLTQHLASAHGIGSVKIREKKHLCSYCSSTFYDKGKLTRHIYTHTGEKPYSCHVCNKGFTDKSYVKGHLKSAHGIIQSDTNV